MLVYIPYFVVLNDIPEDFCVLPGSIYADRVVVQSEKVKETYLSELSKFERKNHYEGKFGILTAKFLPLGSPKFDKVISTKREDCRVPDEWRKLIEKPDGSWKKVVLYNTSITGMLNGNEKVLSKLEYVFDCFKHRNDVVLLWRPHPLNVSTFASMRPQLLNDYQNVVARYRREGWGIYDDTADLNRAIAISDAYYGDWSSLVPLYQITGKPIMIQNLSVC
jgi:CDP-glycerol glycerophosphotransferase (TagB/SpsB family)